MFPLHALRSGLARSLACQTSFSFSASLVTLDSPLTSHHIPELLQQQYRFSSSLGGSSGGGSSSRDSPPSPHEPSQHRSFFTPPAFLKPASLQFNQRRLVGWSPTQLYNVISKVEDYNKFVPWCRKSMVVKRVGESYMEAELEVGFQMLRERYISKVTLQQNTKVRSTVADSALFDHLDSTWVMEQGPTPHSCWLTFDVDFAFRSALHGYVADMFFAEVVKRMVGAFEGQCDKRFGQSSLIRVRQEAFKPRQPEAQEPAQPEGLGLPTKQHL